MSSNDECPICYDWIDRGKNCVVTECGHTFHTGCLMKNVKINGFSCPSCRGLMVKECEEEVEEETIVTEEEESEEEESEEDLSEYTYDERRSENEEELVTEETYRRRRIRSMEIKRMREQAQIEYDIFMEQRLNASSHEAEDEYVMSGFRWLFQQANEEELEEELEEQDEENREAPSVAYVTEQLEMRGVTIEHLVSASLRCVSAYDSSMMSHDYINDQIVIHINNIVYDYITEPLIMDIRELDSQRSLEV